MKMKKYLILVGILAVSCGVLWASQQITDETEDIPKKVIASTKSILQGLEGVYVLVESINPKAEEYGLRRQDIQTDTELQLRQYGIKVFTREEMLQASGYNNLYINVSIAMSKEDSIASMAINVELRENVLLLREPPRICFNACTWKTGMVGGCGVNKIKEIREEVKDHVNKFINDYLAANPKEQTSQQKTEK